MFMGFANATADGIGIGPLVAIETRTVIALDAETSTAIAGSQSIGGAGLGGLVAFFANR